MKANKLPIIKSQFNPSTLALTREHDYEKPVGPSLTVPDDSMSIREIVRRFASGLPVHGGRVGFYDEGDPMPDISKMDLADKQEVIENAKSELEEINQRLTAHKDARNKAKIRKEYEEEQRQKEAEKQALNDTKGGGSTNIP